MNATDALSAAWTAAASQQFYPAVDAETTVIHGEAATAVLMSDPGGRWVVCAHNNDTPPGEWHVSPVLAEAQARPLADSYAQKGVTRTCR